ncbi:MAG TPA: L,D-transpeptidase [Anaerolineaceae bacterium]|nr:L,D-transpeptidase [Anaerolineaceae bacterium]
MKHTFLKVITIFTFAALLAGVFAFQAQAQAATDVEPYTGEPLCLPDIYPGDPVDCLPLGPSRTITSMAQLGIFFPLRPLPSVKPDESYKIAPDAYLKISKSSVPAYTSLDAAIARNSSYTYAAGTKYLAVAERIRREDGSYFRLISGFWVAAAEAETSCCIYSGSFQGLIFRATPTNSFGWTVDEGRPRSGPGYSYPEVGDKFYPQYVMQIYDDTEADNTTWYMIGVNQWVERRVIRQFVIQRKAPEGVDNNRWIEVDLYNQTLGVYEDGELKFATLVATGIQPFYTRPGVFKIYQKKETENMSGAFEADRSDYYYFERVPYTMYYDEARALHGAYWRTLFGYPQSHGCVNLSISDSRWIFEWAREGDWVHVVDPSGKTPTDPAYYTQGGA